MAVPKFSDMSYEDLTEENIKQYIEYGQLFPKTHVASGRIGKHYQVLRDVADNEGNTIPGFYFCSICNEVLKVLAKKGTTPLLRHVDKCSGIFFFKKI